MMPAFSVAIARRQSPTPSVWSNPMLVMTATSASTTLVASNRPSSPTSITATSTATSANHASAAAVTSSNQLGVIPSSGSTAARSLMAAARSSSLMGSPFQAMPLVEHHEVRAAVGADAESALDQQRGDHAGHRALAVGAGDVDHRVGPVRVAEHLA